MLRSAIKCAVVGIVEIHALNAEACKISECSVSDLVKLGLCLLAIMEVDGDF